MTEHRFTLTHVIVRSAPMRGMAQVEVRATHIYDATETAPLRIALNPIKFRCGYEEAKLIQSFVFPESGRDADGPPVCTLREIDGGRWELHPETSNGHRPFTITIAPGNVSEVRRGL